MKSASANLITHLDSGDLKLTLLWTITRRDGLVLRLTEHDITVEVGGDSYVPEGSGEHKQIRTTDKMRGEGMGVTIFFESAAITEADVRAGLWDDAEIDVEVVNWSAPADGTIQLKKLRLWNVEWGEGQMNADLQDLAAYFDRTIGEIYTVDCTVDLGSSECGVRLDPPEWQPNTSYSVREARDAKTGSVVKPSSANRRYFKCVTAGVSGGSEPSWNTTPGGTTNDGTVVWETIVAHRFTGSVTAVTDRRNFSDSSFVEADGWFDFGLLEWTSGDNSGQFSEVEVYLQSGGSFKLRLETRKDIQIGDGFVVQVGCDKKLATCRDKFDNLDNFRGYGWAVPGNEVLFRTPDAQ